MKFIKTIRGVEVEVTAASWDGDPSCGIPYGPEEVYASTLDGQPFDLTDDEVEELTIEACRLYDEEDDYGLDDV